MKIKIVSSLAAILLITSVVSAQESGAIIRGGINFANISVTDDGKVDDANTLTSFQVGIIGDLPLGSIFYLQPGVVFSGKGSKTQRGNASGATYRKEVFNPYYIEVPANLVIKAPIGQDSKFFVGAGPYLGVGIAGKNKVEGKISGIAYKGETDIEFSNDDPTTLDREEGAQFGVLRRFDYGFNGTAGIETNSVVIGVGYGYGLAKLASGTNSSANDKNKHRGLSVTLGIKL